MADVARFPDRHAPYRIYRRKTARVRQGRSVHVYYVSVWDSLTRRYGPGHSTGQTNRTAAERWVSLNLEKERAPALTFEAFARAMFDEGSEYVTYRTQRGRELSWNDRKHCASYLQRYLLPYFGNRRLAEISTLDIK